MIQLPALHDLYAHLEWADALIWRVALAAPAAANDPELRDRLYHIHLTQRVFLDVWTGKPPGRHGDQHFDSLRALHAWARPYYAEVHAFLRRLDPARLSEPTPLPWSHFFAAQLGREPDDARLGETLFQVTSHSTYHRGQVNLRLRALSVEPPLVDYIAWIWLGRPRPPWVEIS
jgi:uncharacterized damage-inducible protein DinB